MHNFEYLWTMYKYIFQTGLIQVIQLFKCRNKVIINGNFCTEMLRMIHNELKVLNVDDCSFTIAMKMKYCWLSIGNNTSVKGQPIKDWVSLNINWFIWSVFWSYLDQNNRFKTFWIFMRLLVKLLLETTIQMNGCKLIWWKFSRCSS